MDARDEQTERSRHEQDSAEPAQTRRMFIEDPMGKDTAPVSAAQMP